MWISPKRIFSPDRIPTPIVRHVPRKIYGLRQLGMGQFYEEGYYRRPRAQDRPHRVQHILGCTV